MSASKRFPPAQIRQKSVIDLTSKTGTYATHAADPMYYALYAANKWVEPLDTYLNDKSLTDAAWFKFDDIIPAWRSANGIDGKLYGMPYDGEVTIQVYRKDLYDAKGLKPADTLEAFMANAAALNTPNDRVWGAALRGVAGAGQNMYIYPSIFREFGGDWMKGGKLTVNGPEAEAALAWYVDVMKKICADGRGELELARYCRRVLARHGRRATSTRIPRPRSSTIRRSRR